MAIKSGLTILPVYHYHVAKLNQDLLKQHCLKFGTIKKQNENHFDVTLMCNCVSDIC